MVPDIKTGCCVGGPVMGGVICGGIALLMEGAGALGKDGNDGIDGWMYIGTGDPVGVFGPTTAGGNVSTRALSTEHTCLIADLVKLPTCPIAFWHTGSCVQPILKTLKEVQQ